MTNITTELERFFDPLTTDEEGREIIDQQLEPRTFVFDLSDAEVFVMNTDEDGVTVEYGIVENPNLVTEVTRIEGTVDALHQIMGGETTPLDALNDGDIFMTSMMAARCYNYGLLRAFRRAAELSGCRRHTWEEPAE